MDGILTNFLLVIIHFVTIFVIPLIVPAFVFLAMSAMTTFQENMFVPPVTFRDVYSANYIRPWWNAIPNLDIFIYA
jgi:hypothetical protein